jgi:putative membrane protein
LILAGYLCARVLEVLPTPIPRTDIVALDVLSALSFAVVDGIRHYHLRRMLVFAGICVVVGNFTENLSISTGFPFGHYFFVELMGPKLFQVPVLLGLAYVGMSYVSWTVAVAILGQFSASESGLRWVRLPVLASFIMTAWDLAQDPVWATVLHGWVWRDGGQWFGVPVSNYFGWMGTLLIIYLFFTLYLRRDPVPESADRQARLWPALVFYGLCALGNMLQLLPPPASDVVQDPTGKLWSVREITTASALVSIFVMGGFLALAAVSIARRKTKATS